MSVANQLNPLLTGVRVLDLTRLLPGPFCTLYFAQMGAEVIKIEDPRGGDYCRALSPELFSLANRGKKSVALDLKNASDVAAFHALVKTADVVIESFRPGVMDRLGCGYAALREINPRIVYAALTGYGQTGPWRDRPGHDINYRACAGELEALAQAGTPIEMDGLPVADLAGALNCAIGVLAALHGARASGRGAFVDAAMFDGVMALQLQKVATMRAQQAGQDAAALTGLLPQYGIYPCADGRFVALGAVEAKFFERFCELAGREDLLHLPVAELKVALAELFETKTRDEWDALLAGEDTCVTAVLSPEEAMNGPHNEARCVVSATSATDGRLVVNLPLHFSGTPTFPINTSPELGAHNSGVMGTKEQA